MDMQGMDHGMAMAPKSSHNCSMMMNHKRHGMMHMTFYWGKDALILFDDFPAGKTNMYVLALFVVFLMSVLIELLSHTRFIKPGSNRVAACLIQTVLHALRIGLAYLVMLALMSFNGGVFLVAVLGHALGFFVSTSAFKKSHQLDEPYDLPPMAC
ncbi:copper transporter 6-like [Cicer arietinum]|uniref:Copper transport protein n=1 Tax=Cicer arietinum TaxID=3827 RepID=A0A1S2YML1_CICAR|nr:copper transporter 6-like [Cicer arietinum]